MDIWRWLRPAESSSESTNESEGDMAERDAVAGRSLNKRQDQLDLQAYTYALSHPEFVRELEEAGRIADLEPASPAAPLTSEGLSRQLDALLKPSLPLSSPATSKLVLLAQGKLQWEDPAGTSMPVLDWVPLERRRLRERDRRRERHVEQKQRRAQEALQPPVSALEGSSEEEEEDDEEWLAFYELHATTLAKWEEGDAIGKYPLPRRSQRASLLTKNRFHKIPDGWALSLKQTAPVELRQMVWRLPWVA